MISANGHLRLYDCYEMVDCSDINNLPNCNCGAPFVFHHSVDETNGEIGDIPQTNPFEVDKPAECCVCHCGNVHEVKEVTYKIPTKE